MLVSSDRGSLPFTGSLKEFLEGASKYGGMVDKATALFERQVAARAIQTRSLSQASDISRSFYLLIARADEQHEPQGS